jgi:uncharacterized protein YlxW (UPF0749 family)
MPPAGTTGGAVPSPPSRPAPPQAVMGLLNYITAHSLDEDYEHVSAQRAAAGEKPERPGSAAMVVMLLFGLLVAIAAIRTAHNAPASQTHHAELVTQVKARSAKVDALRRRIQATQADITALRAQYAQATAEGQALSTELSRLGVWAGSVPVQGPGVRIVVGDAPDGSAHVRDTDLQLLVNGLWQAGAEAVAINSRQARALGAAPERLTSLSAIRQAGSAITVNFHRSLSPPFVITAIGNPDQLPARFANTQAGSTWFDLHTAFGLRFDMTPEESLTLPAAHHLTLQLAHTTERLR